MYVKAQTKITTQYQRDKYKVAVFSLEKRYAYFKNLTRNKFHNNKTKTVLYLIKKYNLDLYRISRIESQQTFIVNYQPKRKEYKRYGIWSDPLVWGKDERFKKEIRVFDEFFASYNVRMGDGRRRFNKISLYKKAEIMEQSDKKTERDGKAHIFLEEFFQQN